MASQAVIFAETIAAMKKAVKRKAYGMQISIMYTTPFPTSSGLIFSIYLDSEEDDPIEQLTNRGNKLRKHARYVREGQMALPNGPEIYKKVLHMI